MAVSQCDTTVDDPDYKKFDARQYLHQRYPANVFEIGETENYSPPWLLPCYHRFYEKFHKEWDISTARLLDIGGGPCIHCEISAAPYVAEIYHSDYVQSCHDEVLKWKNNDPDAYNWSAYFKHVVYTLENQDDSNAVEKRIEMLQNKIKRVVFCDVKNPNLLPDCTGEKFDIIISNACIENLVTSVEEYEIVLKRIKSMLNDKGFFITMANLECSFYYINGKRHPCFPITEQNIVSCLERTGFILHLREQRLKSEEFMKAYKNGDSSGRAFFVAQSI